jgi:transposase InsO family protein
VSNGTRYSSDTHPGGDLTVRSSPYFYKLLVRRRFASQAEAKIACFSYIEGFYNPVRLHSALGYRSPIAYEQEHPQKITTET